MRTLRKPSAGSVLFCLFGLSFMTGVDAQTTTQPVAPAQGQPQQEAPNDLFVNVGKSLIVDSARPIERVSVGLGEVAEVTAVGPQEILVNGKAPGQTSLIVWQQGGEKLSSMLPCNPAALAPIHVLTRCGDRLLANCPGKKSSLR